MIIRDITRLIVLLGAGKRYRFGYLCRNSIRPGIGPDAVSAGREGLCLDKRRNGSAAPTAPLPCGAKICVRTGRSPGDGCRRRKTPSAVRFLKIVSDKGGESSGDEKERGEV